MSHLFSGELQVATEETCKARWSCGKPGQYFRCGFCGYKFKAGDKWRGVYTNDMPGAGGNPLVCEKCNDTNAQLRARWLEKANNWKAVVESGENWHFTKHFGK
jgi:hypothetical protein